METANAARASALLAAEIEVRPGRSGRAVGTTERCSGRSRCRHRGPSTSLTPKHPRSHGGPERNCRPRHNGTAQPMDPKMAPKTRTHGARLRRIARAEIFITSAGIRPRLTRIPRARAHSAYSIWSAMDGSGPRPNSVLCRDSRRFPSTRATRPIFSTENIS